MSADTAVLGIPLEQATSVSQARAVGDVVHVGGQVERDASFDASTDLAPADKFTGALDWVNRLLVGLDGSAQDIVDVQVYVDDTVYDSVREIVDAHHRSFAERGITSSLVFVRLLNPNYHVEIAAIAAPERRTAVPERTVVTRDGYDQQMGQAAAVRVGERITLSGRMALDDDGRLATTTDIVAQAAHVMRDIASLLTEAGSSPADLVSFTTYVTEIPTPEQFSELAGLFRDLFSAETPPAGAMIAVSALPVRGAKVMISAAASVGAGDRPAETILVR